MSEELRKKIDDKLRACEITLSGAFDEGSVAAIMVLVTASIYEGYQLSQEEYKKQLKHEMEGIYSVLIGNGKIDPNQDELWIELLRTTMTLRKKSKTDETDKYLFDIEEAKKRYRITRVK